MTVMQVTAAEDPRVLAAAALRGIDDERALSQGDAGQPAGEHKNLLAVQDIRTQIDVPALKMVLDNCRDARQGQHWLGDVVARVGLDQVLVTVALRLRSPRPEQDPV